MRFVNRATCVLGALAVICALAGCGTSGSLLTASQASDLKYQLTQISQALASRQCALAQNEISNFRSTVAGMGSLASRLADDLDQGATRIEQLAAKQCPATPATHTSTSTTPTTQTTAPATTSTPTITTTTTATTSSITTSAPTTPTGPSNGGAGLPGAGQTVTGGPGGAGGQGGGGQGGDGAAAAGAAHGAKKAEPHGNRAPRGRGPGGAGPPGHR